MDITQPAIIAAIIAGTVTIVTLLVNSIITINSKKSDEKKSFDITLKEKFEKAYSPLHFQIYKGKNEEKLLNEEALDIIQKYGYLLSTELLENLYELIDCEKNNKLNTKEYKNLRILIANLLRKDYFKLQKLMEKDFQAISKKYSMDNMEKLEAVIKNIAVKCTIFVIVTGVTILYCWSLLKEYPEGGLLYVIPFTLMLISFVTIFFILLNFCITTWDFIVVKTGKRKRRFMNGEYVPKTQEYECTACGRAQRKYRFDEFTRCEKEHKFKQKLKSFLYTNQWKR